jgi:hypothetical protein
MADNELLAAIRGYQQQLTQLQNRIAQLERGQRSAQLGLSSIDNGTLTIVDDTGAVRQTIGLQPDGSFSNGAQGAEPPVAPSTPGLLPGLLSLLVTWDGNTSDSTAWLTDFMYVQVHCSTASGFTPDSTTLQGTMPGPGVFTITGRTSGTTYYVVLVGINESGTSSPPSAQASSAPFSVPSQISNGSISQAMLDGSVSSRSLGGITTTVSGTAPSSNTTGDIWIDTSHGNQMNRWNGTAWIPTPFGGSAIATGGVGISSLDGTVTARAIGGITTTTGATAPSSPNTGDIWINSANGNQMNRWSGSAWIAVAFNANDVLTAGTIQAGLLAANSVIAGNVAASAIQAGNIAAGAVQANDLAANSVIAGNIAAGAIQVGALQANAVIAGDVAANAITASNIVVSYFAQVMQDSPTGYWPLDDDLGTVAADYSGGGHNGVATAVTFLQPKAINDAKTASFNGTTSIITTSYTSPALTAFTIELWVNLNGQTQTTSFPQLIANSNSSSSNKGFQLFFNGTTRFPTINLGNGTTWTGVNLGPALPATGWTHLVVTYDGAHVISYQNGVSVQTTAYTGCIPADGAITLGANVGGGANWYKGLLGQAAFTANVAMSSNRIAAHYAAQTGAITAAQIAADTITANQIAANSITTNELAAGIVYAGIVDATTIMGASIVATGSSGDFLAYNGAPAKGSLIYALTGAAFTDSHGNVIPGPGANWGVWDATTGSIKNHFGIDGSGNTYLVDASNVTRVLGQSSTGAMLFYDSTGALATSISPVAGTGFDAGVEIQGNGILRIKGTSGQNLIAEILSGVPFLFFQSGASEEGQAANLQSLIENPGTGQNMIFNVRGPTGTTYPDYVYVNMNSSTKDGAFPAGGNLVYVDRSGTTTVPLTWGSTSVTINDRLKLNERAAAPGIPSGGGYLYVDPTGHLAYRGPSGTITTLANP